MTEDFHLKPVIRWFLIITGTVVGSIIFCAAYAGGLTAVYRRYFNQPRPPLAPERRIPPEPRLESDPGQLLAALRKEEDALLTTYGWVDPAQGIVRIPIERAIALMAQKADR